MGPLTFISGYLFNNISQTGINSRFNGATDFHQWIQDLIHIERKVTIKASMGPLTFISGYSN